MRAERIANFAKEKDEKIIVIFKIFSVYKQNDKFCATVSRALILQMIV